MLLAQVFPLLCTFERTQKPWLSIWSGTLNLLRKLTKEPYMLEMSKKIQKPNGMGLALTFPSPTYVASIASMTKGACPDPASCCPRSHDAAADDGSYSYMPSAEQPGRGGEQGSG